MAGGAHVDGASDEAGKAEHAVEKSVGRGDQGNVLGTTSTQVGDGVEHARGAEAHEADDEHLDHRRVIWWRSAFFAEMVHGATHSAWSQASWKRGGHRSC